MRKIELARVLAAISVFSTVVVLCADYIGPHLPTS